MNQTDIEIRDNIDFSIKHVPYIIKNYAKTTNDVEIGIFAFVMIIIPLFTD